MQPILIFTESHVEKKSLEVLNDLLPQLKNLGYETFYDEAPEEITIEEEIQALKEHLAFLKDEITDAEQAVNEYPDCYSLNIDEFINKSSSLPSRERGMVWEIMKNYYCMIDMANFAQTLLKTYEILRENSIQYVGIDSKRTNQLREIHQKLFYLSAVEEKIPEKILDEIKNESTDLINEITELRNNTMASHYGAISKNTMGRIGYKHALPIYHRLLDSNLGNEDYIFIHIYSKKTQLAAYLEKIKVKLDCFEFPMPSFIHQFDADALSSQAIFMEIKKLIEQAKQKTARHYQSAKHATHFKPQIPQESQITEINEFTAEGCIQNWDI